MKIMLIGEDGRKIGEVDFEHARNIAIENGKDLIMVDAKAGVYKMADSGKVKYDQKQKEKEQRAQRRTHKVKEIKLRLNTNKHDVEIKSKHIKEFLERGMKTKITIQLKGREQSFQEAAVEKMKSIVAFVCSDGKSIIDKGPIVDGKNIVVFIKPLKPT
jgi:translation initiation factor IF-3